MIGGSTDLTAFGLMALTIARAAACAATLTGFILSPTAARTGGRRTTKYGSTLGATVLCCAMCRMALRARSRTPASFLFASDFFKLSTAL